MTELERALEDCLARLASGKIRLEDCLARYPEQAGELRPLLSAAAWLERGRAVSAPSDVKARTRARLEAHMAAHPRVGDQWRPRPHGRSALGSTSAPSLKFRFAFGLAALVALFLTAGTALAQGALPGSVGYGWKIASERVWRAFQPDPLAADLVLADRRADELVQVVDDPHAQAVALQEYRQALETLSQYTLPASQPIIQEALVEQKHSLEQAGLDVPELNELLTRVSSQLVLPESTLAPPASPTLAPTPESTLVSAPESTLALPMPIIPPVLPTRSSVSSTEPRVSTLSLPLPTLDLFPSN